GEDRGVVAQAFLGLHGAPRVEVALLDERLVGPGAGADQDSAGRARYRRPTLGFLPWLALFRRHFSLRLLVFLLIGRKLYRARRRPTHPRSRIRECEPRGRRLGTAHGHLWHP